MCYEAFLHRQVVMTFNAKKQVRGTLKRVARDYLALEEEETQGIWFVSSEHVKQVTAAGVPADPGVQEADADSDRECLADILQQAKQSVVRLEGGGSEPVVGYLADVQLDYLVLCTVTDGFVYVPVRHVFALSIVNAVVQPEFLEWVQNNTDEWVPAQCMETLLKSLIGKRIQLGRGSPADSIGVLKAIHENVLEVMTAPHETTLVPLHHIKAITSHTARAWTSAASL